MLALYRSGRQAEALEAYQLARRTLGDELGLEPGRQLQELEQAILRQDTELDLRAANVRHARQRSAPKRRCDRHRRSGPLGGCGCHRRR